MPKIDAPTVAEHRALKERAIRDAVVELLVNEGQDAVTPAAVAERSGLARTSVYQYHPSSASLVAVAVEELCRQAEVEIHQALSEVGPEPAIRLSAYVSAMLRLAQTGHSPNRSISLQGAPKERRLEIRALHERLMAPLTGIVSASGATNVTASTALAAGAIQGAVHLVEHGTDLEAITEETCKFLSAALF